MSTGRFDPEKRERLRDPDRLERLRLPELMDRILTPGVRTALDVGTGTGIYAEALLAAGVGVVYALDDSEIMLADVRKRLPEVRPIQSSADHILLDDAQVEVTVSGFMIHEMPDYVAALREWKRVSRDRLVIIEWPYIDEEAGPPIEHRMTIEQIVDLGRSASLGEAEVWDADGWIAYIWDLGNQPERE